MEIIEPHFTKARPVTEADKDRVLDDAIKMIVMCNRPHGLFTGGLALAHSQVCPEPLRFFVTKDGYVFVNPEILNHTKVPVRSKEGCLSYADRPTIEVPRFNKCLVKYQQFDKDGKLKEYTFNANGVTSKMFQHEIDHLDGKDIYHL